MCQITLFMAAKILILAHHEIARTGINIIFVYLPRFWGMWLCILDYSPSAKTSLKF